MIEQIARLISNYGSESALLIRLLTTFILLSSIIPLQIREAKVKNGLRMLRKQLLLNGIVFLVVNVITMFYLWAGLSTGFSITSQLLQIVNSLAFLIMAIITYRIYHQQYIMPH